jgi:hypothetical protein
MLLYSYINHGRVKINFESGDNSGAGTQGKGYLSPAVCSKGMPIQILKEVLWIRNV